MKEFSRITPDFEVIVCPPEQSFRWSAHDYPHYVAKWNYHPEYELHLTRTTSGTMMVGDYVGDFAAGNLVLTGPNVPHNWVSSLAPGDVINKRDVLVQFSSDWADRVAGLCPEMAAIRALFNEAVWGIEFFGATAIEGQRLLSEIGEMQGAPRVLHFIALMECLARNPSDRRKLSREAPRIQAQLPENVNRAMRYLNENYAEAIDLADVAEKAGLTAQTFSRFFKRQTGHGFAAYLVRTRVYAACTALTQSHKTITEICFEVGFNSVANFNRQFLKVCGCTPSDYRNAAHRISSDGAQVAKIIALGTAHKKPVTAQTGGGKG